jgi:hypothetical protein
VHLVADHCPGCRGYTAGWEDPCPGLPVPEATPARAPLDLAGHETWTGQALLPDLCHCRIGKPHRAGYDLEHERADGAGPARPRP